MISKWLFILMCSPTLLLAQTSDRAAEGGRNQSSQNTSQPNTAFSRCYHEGVPVHSCSDTRRRAEPQNPERTDADIGRDVIRSTLTDLAKDATVKNLGLPQVVALFPWLGEDPRESIAPAALQAGLYGTSKASGAIGQAMNSEFLSSALPKFLMSPGMGTAVGIAFDSDTTAPPSLDEEYGPRHESWDQIHRNAQHRQDEQFEIFMQMNSFSSYLIQTLAKQQPGLEIHPVRPSSQVPSSPPIVVPPRAAPCTGAGSCGVK